MSIPAHGRLLPISIIDESHIGEKLRLFGILRLSDNIDTLAVLCSSKGSKGILVDLSVPLIEINETGSGLLRESGAIVMVMGTLERNLEPEHILYKKASILVNTSLVVRAMLLRDAGNIDLRVVEDAVMERYRFDIENGAE